MIELYKKINDRTINKTVKKIMKSTRKDDWKYFRIGVEMRGGDFGLAKDIITREFEYMNTTSYEKLLTYHPKKFIKALEGTRWAKSGLEFYPGGSREYVYIGKHLSGYKDENGLLDVKQVNRDFEIIKRDISSYNMSLCHNDILTKEGHEPTLQLNDQLLQFFPYAKEVFVCEKTKSIAVFFEFRIKFYSPEGSKLRVDSWRYDPKYRIKDEKILGRQCEKIKQVREKLNVPEFDDPANFIYWANTNVTKDEVQKVIFLYNSITCESLQYYKECKHNILISEFADKYKDYTIRSVTTTYDPFVGSREGIARRHGLITDDFSDNQTYKELYE